MLRFARLLAILLSLSLVGQQAAALATPACAHGSPFESAESAVGPALDHHAMHGGAGATGAAEALLLSADPGRDGNCECGCPCAVGACLHLSTPVAVFDATTVAPSMAHAKLPAFRNSGHPPASLAVALRPPIAA